VVLDLLSAGDSFGRHASHLPPEDRATARNQIRSRANTLRTEMQQAFEEAYGIRPLSGIRFVEDPALPPAEQFQSLHHNLDALRPAASGTATCQLSAMSAGSTSASCSAAGPTRRAGLEGDDAQRPADLRLEGRRPGRLARQLRFPPEVVDVMAVAAPPPLSAEFFGTSITTAASVTQVVEFLSCAIARSFSD
jgi:hypothetical protein